jgi:GGDEF domain-containing protein
MKMSFRKEDITAHLHGDEFAALASGMTKDQADFAMARLRRNMDDLINLTMPDDPFFSIVQAAVNDKITLGASIGVAVREWKEEDKIPSTKAEFEERVSFELSQLNKDADRKMYEDKMSRRVTRE